MKWFENRSDGVQLLIVVAFTIGVMLLGWGVAVAFGLDG